MHYQSRTCKSLYIEFCQKFSPKEIEKHPQISKLFTYLQTACSTASGNYLPHPPTEIAELIKKFLPS